VDEYFHIVEARCRLQDLLNTSEQQMQNVTQVISLILVLAGVGSASATRYQELPIVAPCRSLTDGADGFRYYITSLDTGTTTKAAADRTFWKIPTVAASDIAFVSDSTICTNAARVHASSVGADTLNPAPVYVLRVGATRYIVFNFTPVGEWLHYAILDSSLVLLGTHGS
jgi:hypothetical protein